MPDFFVTQAILSIPYCVLSSLVLLWSVCERNAPGRFHLGRFGRSNDDPIRCPRCRYDLRGLPQGAPCPECGAGPRARRRRRVLVVHPVRLRQWRLTLIGFAAGLFFPWVFAYAPLIAAYRSEGFSLTQALHCIPIRELRLDGPGPGAQSWPYMLAVAISPVAVWYMPPRRTLVGLSIIWLLGFLATVVVARVFP